MCNSLDLDNFFAYQEAHLEKTVSLLENIWYRGCLMIIKKFKMMKRKNKPNVEGSRWTYYGPDKKPQKTYKSTGKACREFTYKGLTSLSCSDMNTPLTPL